jgi:hypothetical protein
MSQVDSEGDIADTDSVNIARQSGQCRDRERRWFRPGRWTEHPGRTNAKFVFQIWLPFESIA